MNGKTIGFILLFLLNICYANTGNGINTVIDNNLNSREYSFENFKQDFIDGDIFILVDNFQEFSAEFKSKWIYKPDEFEQKIKNSSTGAIKNIDESSFDLFLESFISGKCLMFEEGFPVKFFKVRTVHESIQNFNLYDCPNGDFVENENQDDFLFYYGYKKKNIGNDEYILLGTNKNFDPQSIDDVNTSILGWIKYKSNGSPINTILWNTNIGIYPTDNHGVEINIFRYENDADDFVFTGVADNLLVSELGIETYIERYTKKEGQQINRWLPLYKENYDNPNSLPIGVIEETGLIRSDLDHIVTLKELGIVFLIDNTASMRPVWNNLYTTVNSSIESLLSDFTNIAGDSVQAKIKICYYSDTVTELNHNWIKSTSDLGQYQEKINSIAPINNRYFRPEIRKSLDYIIEQNKYQPIFVIVIGDAGDHFNRGPFFNLFRKELANTLIVPKGVRYNSNLQHPEYLSAYGEFKENFELLYDIPGPVINNTEAKRIGQEIGSAIKKEYKKLIDLYPEILSGQVSLSSISKENLSIFTKNYLQYVRNKLSDVGSGSFYEEGYLVADYNYYNKDILLTLEKLKVLKTACDQFKHNSTTANFEFAIRQLCANYFEIDYYSIDDIWLQSTYLKDFWISVVGSEEIAKKIIPNIFTANISFADIIDNIDTYRSQLIVNADIIREKLLEHIDPPYKGKYTVITNPNTGAVEKYFWVNVETLDLFAGVK